MTDDKRRAQRVPVELWIMVEGVDDLMVLRPGNISATGLLFEAERPLSDVGSLEYLHIAPPNRAMALTIMAQLVRVIQTDSDKPPRFAHAFELFPQSDEVNEQLENLLSMVGADPIREANVTDSLPSATVFRLTIEDLSFRTSWPVLSGAKVQLAVTSADGATRVPFEGHVTTVVREGSGHRVTVSLAEPGIRTAPSMSTLTQATSITSSIDLLFAEWMASQDLPSGGRRHLAGRLDRVPLSGLLMLFDMERLSGELAIEIGGEAFSLYLQKGTLIDVEPASDEALRRTLQRIASTQTGKFVFQACEVDRADRVNMSTTGLLLDLARERDEEGKDDDDALDELE